MNTVEFRNNEILGWVKRIHCNKGISIREIETFRQFCTIELYVRVLYKLMQSSPMHLFQSFNGTERV